MRRVVESWADGASVHDLLRRSVEQGIRFPTRLDKFVVNRGIRQVEQPSTVAIPQDALRSLQKRRRMHHHAI